MSLSSGTRLGPYEILAPLGAGGMGEVYKAKDTRLDRTVAIKVLPPHTAENLEARQRFEREARAVSSLNHPHICTLYDVGRQDATDFLVMEYLEGESLATRLASGPLPVDQALRYAVQISEALAEAHRHGVFHRDLKPGNVILTKSGAKLLDFGLAKMREAVPGAAAGVTVGPTKDLTQAGSILGTVQYMAPEQLEGKDADARSDLFAFGAVLYEMLTGRKAFAGNSAASIIGAIMTSTPPAVSSVQPVTPALDRIVQRCFAKDPDQRWQTAQDLASELKWLAEGAGAATASIVLPPPSARPAASRLPWAVAGVFCVLFLAAMTVAVVHFRETPPKARAIRFTVTPPEKTEFQVTDMFSLSPDGEKLAFTTLGAEGKRLLYVRPLDSLSAQALPGTEGAFTPFWSPDSRYLAFFADGKLKKIDAQGGPPLTLCDAPNGRPGSWNRDGVILFRPSGGPLYRVSAAGGEAKPVTTLDASRQETSHLWTQFLPDDRHFIYLAVSPQAASTGLYAGSLDSKETKFLVAANLNGAYTGPPAGAPGPGYLLFLRGDTLMAQPFDAPKLALSGEPFPVAEQVQVGGGTAGTFNAARFSASANGTLAYRRGTGLGASEMVWLDRDGKRLGTVGEPADYSNPALSPDEKKLAVSRVDPQAKTRDIWIFDLERSTSSRLTFDPAEDLNPIWSPDGSRIAFTSERKGQRDIYQKLSNGTGEEELLLHSGERKSVEDWSADGRFVLYNFGAVGRTVVQALPLAGDRKSVTVLQAAAGAAEQAQLSPNGPWLAYRSTESGRSEIYVQRFSGAGPNSGGKWQISTNGGQQARWRHDGKELFYLAADNKLMAVDVKADASVFQAGIPKPLFEVRVGTAARRNHYVAAANGKRFLVVQLLEQAASAPITVVVNWPAAVKK